MTDFRIESNRTNSTTVTVNDAAGDTTTFPLLAPSATGNLTPLTDAGISYNATTNALTVGDLITKGPWADVRAYGATGDGTTDDTAAFTSALAASDIVLVPNPSVGYVLTSKITVAANKTILGVGKHTTKLLHSYNGDMFELLGGARLENLYLEGQGATYTGNGVIFTSSNGKQAINHCKIINFDGPCLDFAVGAGSQFSGFDIEMYRTSSGTGTDRYAVVISPTQQLSAVPRKFSHIETGGNCSFDFGGCNNTYVTNSFLADLLYTDDTRAAFVGNCRISNAATLTIKGHNNTIVGGAISPAVTIASTAANNVIGPSSFNSPPVVDNSGVLTNQIFDYVHAQTGYLKLNTAISKIVPGATSLSLRNNADDADNIIITNAGAVTLRGTIILPNLVSYQATDAGGTSRSVMVLASDNTLKIGTVGTPNTNGHVLFYVNAVERGRITPSGTWTLNGGVAITGDTEITGALQCDSITNDTGLAAGVYTPTRSAEANMDANVTMTEAQYMRVGNTVTVSGRFTADPTTTATATSFEITLPIASNIGAVEDCAGTAVSGAISECAEITGSVANNTAVITWKAIAVTSQSWGYQFCYQVI